MQYGVAHSQGQYTVPTGSGTQFKDGADVALALGLQAFKFYCTQNYATDYPLQSSWSASPTTCKGFLQTTQAASVLAMNFQTFSMTMFAFGNPANNWWRDSGKADNARLLVEYNEIYDAAVHLLTTYNGTGKTFIIQNWEGDWALMDAFDPATYVTQKELDYNLAFHSARQRAVRDARRNTPHSGVDVLYAVEVNRVLDLVTNPARRRLLRDVIPKLNPDVVSYSAYDSFIATYGYGSNQAQWESYVDTYYVQALQLIRQYAPASKLSIGEVGFEEARIAIDRPSYDVRQMVRKMATVSAAQGASWFFYWQTFDNEVDITTPSGVKGYWLKKPDGSTSSAGLELALLASGG